MIKFMVRMFSLLVCCLTCSYAQMPQQFYYDAYYATSGVPYVGNLAVTTRLYTNYNLGSAVYVCTNWISTSNGFFSVLVGQNTTMGSLSNALASGNTWIEIFVNNQVNAIIYEQLKPVAYAIKADGVRNGAITSEMLAMGAVSSSHLADHAITAEKISEGSLDGWYIRKTGDTITGPLTMSVGTESNLVIQGIGDGIAIGSSANGSNKGIAIGGVADASCEGVAMGYGANGAQWGLAIGPYASAYYGGAAFGSLAIATDGGLAVGTWAKGSDYGIGIGTDARGQGYGNIAIGLRSSTDQGLHRIAIGCDATNRFDESAVIRGTLYLDGGTGVYYRNIFGEGTWTRLQSGITQESDPVWVQASNLYYTVAQSDAKFATGIPVYVESDFRYSTSVAARITTTDTGRWMQAYGWGDHTAAGYALNSSLVGASNSLQAQVLSLVTSKVSTTGDSITGTLSVSGRLVTSNVVEIGGSSYLFAESGVGFKGIKIAYPGYFPMYIGRTGSNIDWLSINSQSDDGRIIFSKTNFVAYASLSANGLRYSGYLQSIQTNNSNYILGNFGVGKTNPSVKLDVAGEVRAENYYGNGFSLTNLCLSSDTNFVRTTGGTISGVLNLSSNLIVNGVIQASIPPQGGISMGIFTNR